MRLAVTRVFVLGAAGLALAPAVWSQTPPPVVPVPGIVCVVTGLRSDSGMVRIGLYNTASRWPRDGQSARACEGWIHGHRSTCEIANVAPGTYALALTHDENNNISFDQGFLGWPLEGFGFSNNVRPRMLGPPSWDSARFVYAGGAPMTVTMTAQYY
ncbi:MAG: DUF2141 domain-containing protein [Deltaproteobacteria bacterium]